MVQRTINKKSDKANQERRQQSPKELRASLKSFAAMEDRSCAYCLNEGSGLVDTRQLPCRHWFCFGCLEDALPTQKVLGTFKCPVCRVEHPLAGHAALQSLPTAVISTEIMELPLHKDPGISDLGKMLPETCCDICLRKDLRCEAALSCIHCSFKMCEEHTQLQDSLWGIGAHPLETLSEFQGKNGKRVSRFCRTHSKQSLDFMCSNCNKMLCLTCWSNVAADCGTGGEHNVKPVEGVARQLKKKLSEAVEPVILLQRKLDKALIQSDETCSAANNQFDSLIRDLHKARDLQLADITTAYSKLEEQINQMREEMLNQYKAYGEKLQAEIVRLQAACKEADEMLANRNNGDVVLRADHVMRSLSVVCRCESVLPAINHVELIPIRHSWLAEVDLRVLPVLLDSQPPADIPALELWRRVDKENKFFSVSYTDQGHMVAGGDGGFDYLDVSRTVINSVELLGSVYWCCVSNNTVYIIHHDDEQVSIKHYSMNGEMLRCWSAGDADSVSVVGERIFVVDSATNQIEVRSGCGDLLYTLTHPSFKEPWSVTAADHQSIIVCDSQAHLVTKFSVWDNTVVWQYAGSKEPWAAAVDEQGRIWVAADSEIHVLSREGELVVRLDLPEADDINDISIHEDQLAVANTDKLLLYNIC